MDFPFSFQSTLVSIIAHDTAIRSGRVRGWHINMPVTLGTVALLQIANAQAPVSPARIAAGRGCSLPTNVR
jgi:hypothetical protein